MSQVDRKTLTEQVAEGLVDLILDGGLAVGDPLPSTGSLARRFDVSVVVVREALATLAGRGVLHRRQGREPVVALAGEEVLSAALTMRARQSKIPLEEFLHCRAALETYAAGVAAVRGSREERDRELRPVLERLQAARRAAEFNAADLELHGTVARLTGNRALVLILGSLHAVIRDELDHRTRGRPAAHRGTSTADHVRLVDAIVAGSPTDAAAAIVAHYQEAIPGFPDVAPTSAGG